MEKLILEYITWDNVKLILWALFSSGVIFELVPIKINPVSSVLRWVGKKLNKDVEEKICKLEVTVNTVKDDLQSHKIESWRRDILDFANSLMLGKKSTKEDFDNIISLHDKYEKYIEERKIENGQITLAFNYISAQYQICRDNNSFYTGK